MHFIFFRFNSKFLRALREPRWTFKGSSYILLNNYFLVYFGQNFFFNIPIYLGKYLYKKSIRYKLQNVSTVSSKGQLAVSRYWVHISWNDVKALITTHRTDAEVFNKAPLAFENETLLVFLRGVIKFKTLRLPLVSNVRGWDITVSSIRFLLTDYLVYSFLIIIYSLTNEMLRHHARVIVAILSIVGELNV